MEDEKTYRTKSGRVLTDADIEALAGEAERGYDIDALLEQEDEAQPGANPVRKDGEA